MLDSNPALSVAGPDEAIEKPKSFLRPAEKARLLSCNEVPIERRQVYAVAIYTAMRQGEIRALRARDVDFDAMQMYALHEPRPSARNRRDACLCA